MNYKKKKKMSDGHEIEKNDRGLCNNLFTNETITVAAILVLPRVSLSCWRHKELFLTLYLSRIGLPF